MKRLSKFSPFARAIGVMGVTAGLVTGVTFAAFNTNSVVLADSDLTVSSDVLRISNGGAYSSTQVSGYTDNLNPNEQSPKHKFYLQNLSDNPLTISVGVSADSGDMNGSQIIFRFYDEDGTEVLAKTYNELASSPQALTGQLDANAAGNGDEAPTEGDYTYTVEVGQNSTNGNTGHLDNYDLTFTGTSIDAPATPPATSQQAL